MLTQSEPKFWFFLKLPLELQLHILEYLSLSDLAVNVCRVSRGLKVIAEDNGLWGTYFDSLWEPSVKKEYQANGKLAEYLGLPSLMKAFKAALQKAPPEAIRKEYLYLHPKTKELVKISKKVSDVRSRKSEIQQKTLEGAAYATCVLFYPPLLCFALEGFYYQNMDWLQAISKLYPEKVLEVLKNHPLLVECLGVEKTSMFLSSFAVASLETQAYFLQSEPLLRMHLMAFEEKILLKEIVEGYIQISSQAVQSFLEHKELIEKYFNSPEDQAWIAQIATAVQQALPPSNNETHTATIAGP